MTTIRTVVALQRDVPEATAPRMQQANGRDSRKLHLASIKRWLDRDAPEYRQ